MSIVSPRATNFIYFKINQATVQDPAFGLLRSSLFCFWGKCCVGNARILAQIEGHSSGWEKLKHPKIVIGFRGSESYDDFQSFYNSLGAERALNDDGSNWT